jgi:hypothetical protein
MENEQIIAQQSTGIYADIQNLQDMAKEVLLLLIHRWPRRLPKPTKLNLYVRADHCHLWQVWASDAFRELQVTVKGVQHYSLAATKNAADMAIAVDAISDFNHNRVSHVAVVSDDSDFISLYAKLAEEAEAFQPLPTGGVVPFLWVFTDRIDTKSSLLQEFFPERYVHVVDRYAPWDDYEDDYDDEAEEEIAEEPAAEVEEASREEDEDEPESKDGPPDDDRSRASAQRDLPVTERIALQLIRDMPVGKFKSTDCQQIIRSNFPGHQLASADGPAFGIIFRRDLLPPMQKRGVQELGNQRPRQYEMTLDAKKSLARL